MDRLADLFDAPPESAEHQILVSSVHLGGPLVSVRYWLGRLLGQNCFRTSDAAVSAALVQYLSDAGYEKGALLASDIGAWSSIARFLQYQWELKSGTSPCENPKLCAALDAVLVDPDLTFLQIAQIAKTTEQQVSRMSDLKWLKELWSRRTGENRCRSPDQKVQGD